MWITYKTNPNFIYTMFAVSNKVYVNEYNSIESNYKPRATRKTGLHLCSLQTCSTRGVCFKTKSIYYK